MFIEGITFLCFCGAEHILFVIVKFLV